MPNEQFGGGDDTSDNVDFIDLLPTAASQKSAHYFVKHALVFAQMCGEIAEGKSNRVYQCILDVFDRYPVVGEQGCYNARGTTVKHAGSNVPIDVRFPVCPDEPYRERLLGALGEDLLMLIEQRFGLCIEAAGLVSRLALPDDVEVLESNVILASQVSEESCAGFFEAVHPVFPAGPMSLMRAQLTGRFIDCAASSSELLQGFGASDLSTLRDLSSSAHLNVHLNRGAEPVMPSYFSVALSSPLSECFAKTALTIADECFN